MNNEKKVLIFLVLVLLAEAGFYHSKIYYTEKHKSAAILTEEISENIIEKEEPVYDKVKLSIVDIESKSLVNKKDSIIKSKEEKKIKLVFDRLKEISKEGFDKNTEIRNVFIEGNDRVYINLSRDFIKEGVSSDIKTLTLYSVVNSICALGYSKIKFMIENEDINKIGGEIPVQDYFEKDTLLSKGE
jgi:hypothetical protein